MASPDIVLSNGVRMPILGLGTSHAGGYSHETVVHALTEGGYTHIDTAELYCSETSIGKDIVTSGVSRSKLFITTKAWPSSYQELRMSLQCSLRNLNTTYVDLYLLHWPGRPTWITDRKQFLKETWKIMEELYAEGMCKAIGVSNFLQEHLEEMFEFCTVKPHVNQIEFHPCCNPKELVSFCQQRDIVVEGYCPLARGKIWSDHELSAPLEAIALKHGKTAAQILLRWSVQHNVVTIPMSTKMERVEENIALFDFVLSEDEMKVLDGFQDLKYIKICWEPANEDIYRQRISEKIRNNEAGS